MKKSIVFIIVYFGIWPTWFKLFLQSCKKNNDINFLIFTDSEVLIDIIENIKFVEFSLKKFNHLASARLGTSVHVLHPYKITDFKPLFGFIFEEYINDFEFWGYCDIDLIFGDIKKEITKDLLDKFDVITARKEYLVGHFTLYRNTEKINTLFKESNDYERVIKTDDFSSFDECGKLWLPLLAGFDIALLPAKIESMTHVVRRRTLDGDIKSYFKSLVAEQADINFKLRFQDYNDILLWKNGQLSSVYTQKQFMYFHFNALKRSKNFIIPNWEFLPEQFYITKYGMSEVLNV